MPLQQGRKASRTGKPVCLGCTQSDKGEMMYRRYAEALGNDSRMDKLEDTYSTGKNL